jgi:lactate dehydrogenase-like 2-hydroxyacid dehydrogenase
LFTFEHLVIMEPSNVSSEMMETLKKTAKQITAYDTVPKGDTEILKRIQDADGILMSYTSSISREVLENLWHLQRSPVL